MPNLSLIYW